jgi:ribonucleoside-diphosphate reductase alpha chain
MMAFQDALHKLGISYASQAAVEFADRSMESIAYHAILASTELAEERGTYSSYSGSKWQRGILPIDSIALLEQERGETVEMDRTASLDWTPVREAMKQHGMRNSNVMAIAPTATISSIVGVSQSIEPSYKNLYVKSNLSGEFTIINDFLVNDLKELGLWNADTLEALKYFDGSLQELPFIPEQIKQRYLTAFDIEPDWLIECASRRQKWIDMGQSLNLYLFNPSGKKLHETYTLAWRKGLKTTYYLRTLAATQVEKSTVDINKWGIQPRWMKNSSPSSAIQVERSIPTTPITCSLDGDCEACQ